jgi:hypothetical protein
MNQALIIARIGPAYAQNSFQNHVMDNSGLGFPDFVGAGCVGSICAGVGDTSGSEGDWMVDLASCSPDAFTLLFLGFFTSFYANAGNGLPFA